MAGIFRLSSFRSGIFQPGMGLAGRACSADVKPALLRWQTPTQRGDSRQFRGFSPQTQDASAGRGVEGARYRYPSNARQQASVTRVRLVRDGLFHERYCGSLAARADAASPKMPPAFCAP